jgi:hypothetical protein
LFLKCWSLVIGIALVLATGPRAAGGGCSPVIAFPPMALGLLGREDMPSTQMEPMTMDVDPVASLPL